MPTLHREIVTVVQGMNEYPYLPLIFSSYPPCLGSLSHCEPASPGTVRRCPGAGPPGDPEHDTDNRSPDDPKRPGSHGPGRHCQSVTVVHRGPGAGRGLSSESHRPPSLGAACVRLRGCQRVGDLDLVNSTQRSFLSENKDWYAVCGYSMTTLHREIVTVVQGMNEVHGNFYAHAQELHTQKLRTASRCSAVLHRIFSSPPTRTLR
eukprot:768750-Hanusia_phi.AAC.7